MLNVSVITLGCKVNQFESEAMMELFESNGFRVILPEEKTDIFVINTCTVTSESDRKSRQLINKCKRMNENALVVAVGCSVQLNCDKIKENTDADIIIGTKNKSNIVEIIKEKLDNQNNEIIGVEKFKPLEKFDEMTISKEHDKTRANIKIQDGCNQFCTYCIIPYVRGPIRSRRHEDIIKEVYNLAKNGYKEVVINGIHIASYGKDLNKKDALISLIEDINDVDGIERIRFGSLEPRIITKEFMDRLSKLEKVCDQFHLSLQSGSDKILKSMNRRYTTDEYFTGVELIREYYPNCGITTDIIVGFPGEGQEEYNQTIQFVEKVKFSRIHVFKYSIRQGTKAATYNNQVPKKIKIIRSRKLIEIAEKLSNEFMNSMIDNVVDVLIEKKEDNFYSGYTTNYIKICVNSKVNIENSIVKVKIIGYEDDCLKGIII